MKKTFLVLGAIMFAFLFAGCKGAEEDSGNSPENLKEALLELADDDGDKTIESLFENPKVAEDLKLSTKDENTLIIKDFEWGEPPIIVSFTLTDDGIKVTYTDDYFDIKDSFILEKIEVKENKERSIESDFWLSFQNKDNTKEIMFTFTSGIFSNIRATHIKY